MYDAKRRALRLTPQAASCELSWKEFPGAGMPDRAELVREILLRAQISYDLKWNIMRVMGKYPDPAELMAELNTMPLPASVRGAVLEILNVF